MVLRADTPPPEEAPKSIPGQHDRGLFVRKQFHHSPRLCQSFLGGRVQVVVGLPDGCRAADRGLEGAIEGFIGAGLAVAFIVVAQQLAVDRITDLPDWINVAVQHDYLYSQGALVLLFGVLAGLIGSSLSLAVHRTLRS